MDKNISSNNSTNNSTLIDDDSVLKVYYQVTPKLQNSIKAPSSGQKDLRSFLMHIFAIFFRNSKLQLWTPRFRFFHILTHQ